ncbi:MAG: DUF4397 domain-containing protein [Gemmatimonadaceae bacterium]|nr:DUF4397 domain-containing protein [Gemmatimonadaceae bacterium]
MKTFRSIAILLGAFALASCDTEGGGIQDITGALPGARVKFFNFGVNAPSVNFYANTAKVTATTSATGVEALTGVSYGSVGSGGFYSALTPGQYSFIGKIAATVDKDLTVATVPGTLADGKAYSVYVSGFYDATAKTVEGFVVEDPFDAAIDYTVAYVRFVNAISNSQPMTMYAKNTTTLTEVAVGAAVAYKAAGAFTSVPNGVYDLSTRTAGSTTNAIARTAVSLSAGKVYTISARGDITVTSTTATNRPFLDNTANR